MHEVTIADTAIRTDAAGRYCLKDLHRAAGGQENDRPWLFMRRPDTRKLIAELIKEQGNCAPAHSFQGNGTPACHFRPPVQTVGGRGGGTYVVRELVYHYAMWISPAFSLNVIRAYDSLAKPSPIAPDRLVVRRCYQFDSLHLPRVDRYQFRWLNRKGFELATQMAGEARDCMLHQLGELVAKGKKLTDADVYTVLYYTTPETVARFKFERDQHRWRRDRRDARDLDLLDRD